MIKVKICSKSKVEIDGEVYFYQSDGQHSRGTTDARFFYWTEWMCSFPSFNLEASVFKHRPYSRTRDIISCFDPNGRLYGRQPAGCRNFVCKVQLHNVGRVYESGLYASPLGNCYTILVPTGSFSGSSINYGISYLISEDVVRFAKRLKDYSDGSTHIYFLDDSKKSKAVEKKLLKLRECGLDVLYNEVITDLKRTIPDIYILSGDRVGIIGEKALHEVQKRRLLPLVDRRLNNFNGEM